MVIENKTNTGSQKCLFCKGDLKIKSQKGKKFCSTNCRVKAYQKRKRNTPSMNCYICKEGVLTFKILFNKPPQIKCTNCNTIWKTIEN